MTTSSDGPALNSAALTLDSVFQDLEYWRANKNQYPNRGIPDELWLKIFKLTETRPTSQIKKMFGLNSDQYKIKYQQLIEAPNPDHAQSDNSKKASTSQAAFCEVNVKPSSTPSRATKDSIDHLNSNDDDPMSYLSLSTHIVEVIHPDGHRLKIHTTTKMLREVIQSFFEAGGSAI